MYHWLTAHALTASQNVQVGLTDLTKELGTSLPLEHTAKVHRHS